MVTSRLVESSRRSLYLAAAFLIAATFLAYAGVRGHDFVGYDDVVYVSENPNVLNGLNSANALWALTSGYAANWHPLTWLSHMLDVELFGVDPGAMARTNVVIHGLTSVLVLVFARGAIGSFWPALLVALLFALHPLRVESVAWIAERKDVLSGFFWMATLIAWTRYVKRPDFGRYTWVVLAFVCGLMSKPVLVTLPFVLLLLDIWPFRREVLPGGEERVSVHRLDWRRLVVEKVPLFAIAVASSWVTYRVQTAGGASRVEGLSPFDERLANAITSYVGYLSKTFWPVDLACFYPLPPSSPGVSPWTLTVAGAALLLLGISWIAWRERGRRPWLGVGWCWYLGTLVPMIGLVQVGNQSMADRYAYLPTIGIYLVVAGELHALGAVRAKRGAILIGAVAAIVFGFLTPRQVAVWRNAETLYGHAIEVTEGNYLAHYNLGTGLLRGNPPRLPAARRHLEEAVRIHPDHAGAQLNLGAVEWLSGNPVQAEVAFEKAVRLDPENPEAHLSLGTARFESGQALASIRHFQIAVALEPTHGSAWTNLGTVLISEDRDSEARRAFERALEISPGLPAAAAGLSELRRRRMKAQDAGEAADSESNLP